jgi:hypothetical protein
LIPLWTIGWESATTIFIMCWFMRIVANNIE